MLREARDMTKKEWETHLEDHPNADKSKHTITDAEGGEKKDDKGKGKGKAKVPPKVKVKVKPEELDEFAGDIPEYRLEIIAGGDDGEITEADLRRAKAVKVQLRRGIQAAADICKISPPVCEGNLGVARSSMPQLSADEPVPTMLQTDDERIEAGDKDDGKFKRKSDGERVAFADLSEKEQAKHKKGWATMRKFGEAAVAAGADPKDERTVFEQTLDALVEEGTEMSSREPPHEKVLVGELKATQREIKAGKTYGIANAYLQGDYDPREAPIIISADNHILDGHHRYSAMITADPNAKMNVVRVDMPMKQFLERAFDQPGVFRADLQDNIVPGDDPLDLARPPGSAWQQKGKWYAKNKDGVSLGPYKDKDKADQHAASTGTMLGPENQDKTETEEELSRATPEKTPEKKPDKKPKKKASSNWTAITRQLVEDWNDGDYYMKDIASSVDQIEGTLRTGRGSGTVRAWGKAFVDAFNDGHFYDKDLRILIEDMPRVASLTGETMRPTLKGRLAKLAFDNPDMRDALVPLLTKTAARPLSEIANDIRLDWGGGSMSKVNYAAKPYLEAMFDLRSINDTYGYDSADSIVRYFLSNARSWRGPVAKQIKAELKKMLR
jgi:hypothetical protein